MRNTITASATIEQSTASAPVARTLAPGRVRSADGTRIAFDRIGRGEPVILVDGALCRRGMGPSQGLAEQLATHFTVITYDRRGRGESSDTAPYAIEREVEDIAALLAEAGGSAYLWGMSSGAVLALEAAQRLAGIRKLALYEAPFIVDGDGPKVPAQWDRIDAAIAAGRRGDAVRLFLRGVGLPGFVIALMRVSPIWGKLTAIAHTLPYDGTLVRDYQRGRPLPAKRWDAVTIPALVMAGGRSPEWMHRGNGALAQVMPNAMYCTLEGQTHLLKPKAHAPALVEFFGG